MNVLVVDDMPDVVHGIVNGISWKQLGIDNVFQATSAAEAKTIMLRERIDVLLSDVEMPGESGISLLEWARSQKISCECIFLSAHPDFQYVKGAMNLEGYDYLLQPARNEDIETAIAHACQHLVLEREKQRLVDYARQLQSSRDSTAEIASDQDTAAAPAQGDEKRYVEQIKQYVGEHLDENITREEIAASVFLSEGYVSRLFSKQTGLSLKNYIVAEKMRLARTLIATTNLPISIIAVRVGYTNFSHFSQTYRKEFGVSPTEERRKPI